LASPAAVIAPACSPPHCPRPAIGTPARARRWYTDPYLAAAMPGLYLAAAMPGLCPAAAMPGLCPAAAMPGLCPAAAMPGRCHTWPCPPPVHRQRVIEFIF
jgi:hypothetical protein